MRWSVDYIPKDKVEPISVWRLLVNTGDNICSRWREQTIYRGPKALHLQKKSRITVLTTKLLGGASRASSGFGLQWQYVVNYITLYVRSETCNRRPTTVNLLVRPHVSKCRMKFVPQNFLSELALTLGYTFQKLFKHRTTFTISRQRKLPSAYKTSTFPKCKMLSSFTCWMVNSICLSGRRRTLRCTCRFARHRRRQ